MARGDPVDLFHTHILRLGAHRGKTARQIGDWLDRLDQPGFGIARQHNPLIILKVYGDMVVYLINSDRTRRAAIIRRGQLISDIGSIDIRRLYMRDAKFALLLLRRAVGECGGGGECALRLKVGRQRPRIGGG